jgi:hypothetical protein
MEGGLCSIISGAVVNSLSVTSLSSFCNFNFNNLPREHGDEHIVVQLKAHAVEGLLERTQINGTSSSPLKRRPNVVGDY